MTLINLANKITTKWPHTTDPECAVPEQYVKAVAGLVKTLSKSVNDFGGLSFPFIDNAFLNADIESKVMEKITDDEVPDGVINGLSVGLYNKLYNDLSDEESKIIKLLTLYIIISI